MRCCSSSPAPLTASPWIGEFVQRGAQLAADELNDDGGIDGRPVEIAVLDNAGSPQRAVANAREAVDRGAAALITDGVGAIAVAEVSDPAKLPVFVVFEGGESIIDPQARPTLFRLAPANTAMSRRLADYVSEKTPHRGTFGRLLLLRPRGGGADPQRSGAQRDRRRVRGHAARGRR